MATNLDFLRFLAIYDRKIGVLFDKYIKKLADSGLPYPLMDNGKMFHFSDYPNADEKAGTISKEFVQTLQQTVLQGISGAIEMAYNHQQRTIGRYSKYSEEALDAFVGKVKDSFIRKRITPEEGMNLSMRVWNYAERTKAEFELGLSQVIEDGLRKGVSAEEIGRQVRGKLNDPDAMWRRYHVKQVKSDGTTVDKVEWRKRVIDENGNVRFVKEELSHPGVGVYRSARKNALRMTATEINMAYKYADVQRYQNEPFVTGYRISLSNNRHGLTDMCDELVGDYPKWFEWGGWHPFCKCMITAIMCSKKEMQDIMALPEEEYASYKSPSLIDKMPDQYDAYVAKEEPRIIRSMSRGTTPYWIRDNYKEGDFTKGLIGYKKPSVQVFDEKSLEMLSLEKDLSLYSEEIRKNFEDIEKALGVKRGSSMTYDEANYGKENPRYLERGEFRVNCQTCTVTHELRRRGFEVTAKGREEGFNTLTHNGEKFSWRYRFLNADGTKAEPVWSKNWGKTKGYRLMSRSRLDEFFKENINVDGGRYEIYCQWKERESAHVFCAEKNKNGILFFDPQSGKGGDAIKHYFDSMMPSRVYVMRIDDKLINPEMMKAFNAKDGAVKAVKTKAQRMAEIVEIAKKRHAERDSRLIAAKWHTRKVLALSDEYPSLKDVADHLRKNLYAQTDSKVLEAKLRDFAREVAFEKSITPKDLLLSELKKNFTQEEIEAAFVNSKRTMDKYASLDIAGKIDKYRFEADWIRRNRSFSTKEVVAKIYEREAARLEQTLEAQKLVSRAKDATKELKDLYGFDISIVKGNEDALSIKRLKHQLADADAIRNKFTEVKKVMDFAATSRSKPLKTLVEDLNNKIKVEGIRSDFSSLLKKVKDRIDQIKRDRAWYSRTTGKGVSAKTAGDIAKKLGDKCPKTLQHLQDVINKHNGEYLKVVMKEEGLTKEEAMKVIEERINQMKQAFDKYDFGIRIDPDYLENCFDEHFKNLVETGRSGGSSWVPQRKHNEKVWFGMPDDIKPEEYSKYGCLLDSNIEIGLSDDSATQYGNSYIRFKKDKVLCTWSWNDSLDHISTHNNSQPYQGFPTLVSDPKPESFGLNSYDYMGRKPDTGGTVNNLFSSMNTRYVELQYHGILDFDCVQSVSFKSMYDMNTVGEKTLKKIIAKNIPIYCLDGGKLKEAYITSQGTVGLH